MHVRAQRRGVRGQVHRQRLTGDATGRRIAVAVLRAESLRAERPRERADAGVALAVAQHDDQLEALLHRGDDLLRHHEVGTVAHHHIHFPRRGRPSSPPARRQSRSPCRNSRTPRDRCSGRCERHNLCRSPGKLPAAQTTTSSGCADWFTAPITSAWAKGALPRGAIRRSHLGRPRLRSRDDGRPGSGPGSSSRTGAPQVLRAPPVRRQPPGSRRV